MSKGRRWNREIKGNSDDLITPFELRPNPILPRVWEKCLEKNRGG